MSQGHSPNQHQTISRFGNLLVGLVQRRIDFAVVGGLAVIFNGYERVTLDADILISPEPQNVTQLLDFLQSWGEGWARELTLDDFIPQEGSIRVSEEFDLDIFTLMRGRTLNDFRPRLKNLPLGGVLIPYLSPEDLILLKEGSGREKDQMDVAAMRMLLRKSSS